jgi:hypothetical protein
MGNFMENKNLDLQEKEKADAHIRAKKEAAIFRLCEDGKKFGALLLRVGK